MRHIATRLALIAIAALACVGFASAQSYEVTVTNLTGTQIFSPPVVVVHDSSIALFEAGQPASEGLRYIAEDGNAGPLLDALPGLPEVSAFAASDGPLLPGQSVTIEVDASAGRSVISVLGMLVTTNDAFFAVNSLPAPSIRFRGLAGASLFSSAYANAWDAGTEFNSESCEEIPGPPCTGPGVRNTEGAEGFVHVHRGIAGNADLSLSAHDWRNPVALVSVQRLP